ncbi:MAG: hypothetical protein AAFX54_16300 [Pseudomonadota bacterium]
MAMTLELVIHVVGGGGGLVSGATAIVAKKGGPMHRLAGNTFFGSMAVMAVSGAHLAWLRSVNITVLAGLLTLYLVTSSWLTVRQRKDRLGVMDVVVFFMGTGVAGFGLFLSWRAYQGVTDSLGEYSVPAAIYFIFTSIALLAVATDLRVLIQRGAAGKQRILRHLWRMSVPLYIAASSFFTGQQKVFPKDLQGSIYLSLPENAVLLIMLFWLAKVWITWPASGK